MAFYVYILRCSDHSYYTGHTDNLEKRMAEHQSGECDGYTSTRLPVEFLWSQDCTTREEALSAEQQIKGWSRKKKEAMMRGDWKSVQQIAWGTNNPLPDRLKGTSINSLLRDEAQGAAQRMTKHIKCVGEE
jgi:predicted GIY-YIG superfamily endonuclease